MSLDSIKPGDVINNRFQVKSKLGEGGFAVVFEGTDINLERRVAIKILHGALTDAAHTARSQRILERFEREAKLAASVDHPCLVKIYDAGEVEGVGVPFMVMEFLEGSSLEEHIQEHGAMPAQELIPFYVSMLTGLGLAHKKGIVHKDLKPDNIFYRHPGSLHASLCIVDFGIAHIDRSGGKRVTQDGEFFGTPSYMAPEYITDQKVSPALDVYQMGLILVECLTGRAVIEHTEPVAALLLHLKRDFKIPSVIVESALGPIIDKATALEPQDRYPDALAFAQALNAVHLADLPRPDELFEEDGQLTSKLSHLPTMSGMVPGADHESMARLSGQYKLSEEPPTAQPAALALKPAQKDPSLEEDFSHVAPPSNKKMYAALAVILVGVVVLGGIIVALTSGGERDTPVTPTPPIAQTTPETTPPETTPETTPAETTVVVKETTPVVETTPPIKPVRVSVTSSPRGASAKHADGTDLGQTPLEVEVMPGETMELTLTRRGYEPLTLTLDGEDTQVSHKLERIKRSISTTTKPVDKPDTKPVEKKPTLILPD